MKKEEILKKLSEIDKKEFSILELGLFGSFQKILKQTTVILIF